jgi:hypothetical protein
MNGCNNFTARSCYSDIVAARPYSTPLQKVEKESECHSRERVPSMGRRAMSGNGAKSILFM